MRRLFVLIPLFVLCFFIIGCETEITKYCRIIYDGNGGTSENRPVDINNYTQGSKAIVLENTYKRNGYTFKHWNTHWLDTGESYNPGDLLVVTDNYFIHLYAIWQ
jgi:hypothetical protein